MQEGVGLAELDGSRMAYEVRGTGGEAIVFVHGWSGDRTHWHHQMDGIDAGRRLVALDLIGHGESDAPQVTYTMELFARSVAAVLDDLGIVRAMLVGHSNGVPVVRQFYRLYPERTEAIIAVDGALKAMPRKRLEMMTAPLRRPDWREYMDMLLEQTSKVSGGVSDEDVETVKRTTLATPHHVLLGSADSMMDAAIWKEDVIDIPLLVLAAKTPFSDMYTEEYQAFVRGLAPHVEYHVWENATHMLTMEFPERFNRLVEEFVGRLP